MPTPTRYNPVLVALHWLLAAMVIIMLMVGLTQLGETPNDDAKIQVLSMHMPIGITILALMLVRLFVRFFTKKPSPASVGNPLLDKVGVGVHYLLYLAVFGMAVSGLGISAQAGLPTIVFEGSGSLPPDFSVFPPADGHGFLAYTLSGLVLLHVGAALYHQFVRRDNLLARMWFGK